MKRMGLIAAAALLLGGCATVEISSPGTLKGVDVKGAGGKADRVIMLANEGYYLFHSIPLAAGNVGWDGVNGGIKNGPAFFSDELCGDKMFAALGRYADSMNCDLIDIVINNKNEYRIGLFGVLDWFNTIIAYNGITYSAVLRPRK